MSLSLTTTRVQHFSKRSDSFVTRLFRVPLRKASVPFSLFLSLWSAWRCRCLSVSWYKCVVSAHLHPLLEKNTLFISFVSSSFSASNNKQPLFFPWRDLKTRRRGTLTWDAQTEMTLKDFKKTKKCVSLQRGTLNSFEPAYSAADGLLHKD